MKALWSWAVAVLAASACAPASDPTAASGGSSDGTADASTASGSSSGVPSTDTTGSIACDPTTPGIVRDVFIPQCAVSGCHVEPDPASGIALGDAATIELQLVGVPSACDGSPLLVAGDAAASLLLRKLEGVAGCGDAMPPAGMLPSETIACVSSWIEGLEVTCEQCGTGACVDPQTDANHCGSCDAPCPTGVACVAGTCDCGAHAIACGDVCVDPLSNPDHCGGCDAPCPLVCLAGRCASDCGTLVDCDAACVDTTTSAEHCGGCNQPCGAGQACVDGACVCDAPQPSFAADVAPLLAAACTGPACHAGAMPKADLDLRATVSWSELVEVPASQCGDRLRVTPGDPGASYLMSKLLGVDLCSGTAMPKAGQSLPAEDLATLSAWICHGAADD